MELINATKMLAGYTMGMDPSGREYLLVVVKGTYSLPLDGSLPVLLEEQIPPVEADVYTGDPGFSAPLYETDYALRKKRCDVIINGSAYAPEGRAATKVQVGLKLGPIKKAFNVVGDRVWESPRYSIGSSFAIPFVTKSITYDVAFGGTDDFHPDENKHSAYMLNPIGCGYHHEIDSNLVDGTPLPNTEELNATVTMPHKKYRPMGFGVIGRNWKPRYRYAGTYDQNWLDNSFPFLPEDFQDEYFQCVPADQQMNFINGGEVVELLNLTPQGRTLFKLPKVDVPVCFFRKKGDKEEMLAVADTLLIEPDQQRFSITWRASLPLKKNMFEISQVLVDKRGNEQRGRNIDNVRTELPDFISSSVSKSTDPT
ncbi:hypothetical protein MNBD_GAMMA18-113 [hydrothermal vent metagenome]|uniref:DUF2169 domain-containing protein n=1 Tax=hydrothermal vent metagenome TaxID=652676 RepID=A0A3B0YVT7_9ZZZZ